MQANDERDQVLENLAAGKTMPKPKRGGIAKVQPTGELGEAVSQRHTSAGVLGKQQAMQDLSAMAESYSQTLAAGMTAFNGVAAGTLTSMLSDEFQVEAGSEDDFDFLGEVVASGLTRS